MTLFKPETRESLILKLYLKAEGFATISTNLVVSIAFFSFSDSLFSLTRLSKQKEAEKYKISFC